MAKKIGSRKPTNENVTPVECSLSCGLIGTVKELASQVNELVLAKDKVAKIQNEYIKVLENQFTQDEYAKKRQHEMEKEISSLKNEIKKIRAEKFVKDLIDFDDGADTDGNRGNSRFFFCKFCIV